MSDGSTGNEAGAAFNEDDLLPISALQHLLFCERQCALIHVEGLWAENALTVQGRQLHERPDRGRPERRGGVRTERAVPLRSFALGVWGKADVVEFPDGAPPVPVEYKRGRSKRDGSDRVQLCAQAMCLEEMLGVAAPVGRLFYGQTRRREEVALDAALREQTRAAARRLHEIVRGGTTPPAERQKKCERCSLLHLCLPGSIGRREGQRRSAERWAQRALAEALSGDGPVELAEPLD